jgi:hypothetical protein
MSAIGRVVRPERQRRAGLARRTSKHRHGPSHVAQHHVERLCSEQRAQPGPSRPDGPGLSGPDFGELMHARAGFLQLLAEPAFEAQREFGLHGRAKIAETGQSDQRGFDASVQIAAADVQDA